MLAKKSEFKGRLTESMPPRRFGLLMNEEEMRKKSAEWHKEDMKNLLLLCDHYGIKEKENDLLIAFFKLSLALAKELAVPAFVEQKPRGRKKKWTEFNKAILVAEVERVMEPNNPQYGVSWATAQLAKKEPWRSFVGSNEEALGSDPSEVLRQIYYESKETFWASVTRDACRYHMEGYAPMEEWKKTVEESVRNP